VMCNESHVVSSFSPNSASPARVHVGVYVGVGIRIRYTYICTFDFQFLSFTYLLNCAYDIYTYIYKSIGSYIYTQTWLYTCTYMQLYLSV
jgi:hypothetical protein